ncbi:MAG: SEC-C domain-containing protein [Acidobacteriia bacterium]|nr:SEC-C domain-containing protein [Terriglobia bacterium]
MSKIGRNDLCHCGSGEKYKRCCLEKDRIAQGNENQSVQPKTEDSLRALAQRVTVDSLVSALAGLMVLPDNMAKVVLLERAIQAVLESHVESSVPTQPLTSGDLAAAVGSSQIFAALRMLEDPAEGFFSENISCVGGNYTIFPGINNKSGFVLQHLLRATMLEGHSDGLPDKLKYWAGPNAHALLLLSNEVAKRLGYTRWISGPNGDDMPRVIVVPDDATLATLQAAVSFSRGQLDDLLQPFGLPFDCFSPFIVELGAPALGRGQGDNHVLHSRPILKCGEKYILSYPTSVSAALRHSIISAAVRTGCEILLAGLYHRQMVDSVDQSLRVLRCDEEALPLPTWSTAQAPCIAEKLCRVDRYVTAYVMVFSDSLNDYKVDTPFGMWDQSSLSSIVDARLKEIVPFLRKELGEKAESILLMVLHAGLGRAATFGLDDFGNGTHIMLLDVEELDVIAKDKESDALRLWKFACADGEFRKHTRIMGLSTLDCYALFCLHQDSFYLNDNRPPSLLNGSNDICREMRIKSTLLWDPHLIRYWRTGGLIDVVNRYDSEIPIVIPSYHLGVTVEQAVICSDNPIWVVPKQAGDKAMPRDLEVLWADAIAYWIWQLCEETEKQFNLIAKARPEVIFFGFDDISVWSDLARPLEADEGASVEVPYSTDVSQNTITLSLPHTLRPLLNRADNAGERILVDALLKAFDDLRTGDESEPRLDQAQRMAIVDQCAPLGNKKKVFTIDTTNDPALRPDGLPPLRLLQEYDLSRPSDGLAVEVNRELKPPLPLGDVPRERRKDLVQDILSHHLSQLEEKVRQFDGLALLNYLIAQNEALTNDYAFSRLIATTSAACFAGTVRQARLNAERWPKVDRTALATRFLIEFVAANIPNGKRLPSILDVDELLGLAGEYINWGFLGDEIRCRVFAHELSILESGRVGIVSEGRTEAVSSFYAAKALESVENLGRSFGQRWSRKQVDPAKPAEVEEVEAVFAAEYGIVPKEFFGTCVALAHIGFELGGGAVSLQQDELVAKINSLAQIPPASVRRTIDELALDSRPAWREPPGGFIDGDIQPFCYNRRLSFIRRPLIRLPWKEANGTIVQHIYWGPRHVDRAAHNLMTLILDGRYKESHCRSTEMRTYLGKVADELGREFEKQTADWAESHLPFKVRRNVHIGPGEFFDSPVDIGDLDVVLIDTANHCLFCPECKDIQLSRNAVEMSGELNRLIRGKPGKPDESRVAMHAKRVSWLASNWPQVVGKLGLDAGPWSIVPIILTSQEIAAPYIIDSPIPFLSMNRLKRELATALNELARGAPVAHVG